MRKSNRSQTESFNYKPASFRIRSREAESQTCDDFKKPVRVRFVPAASGIDSITEIGGEDLFDFDTEAEPILEVLMARTLEVARREVAEEEELRRIREHQREFERKRHAELLEVHRLEAADRRKTEEKIRRINQQRSAVELEKIAQSKAIAVHVAKTMLSDVHSSALRQLNLKGAFDDPYYVNLVHNIIPDYVREGIDMYHTSHASHVAIAASFFVPPPVPMDPVAEAPKVLQLIASNACKYNQDRVDRVCVRAIEKKLARTIISIIKCEYQENAEDDSN
jgi:hypothetical protein